MKDVLAEQLLARVLNWKPADVARERPKLQAMAGFKYDNYEQFSPGMRFVESLAKWLDQFQPSERPVAYDFITTQLVFYSAAEINHLVAIAYPDIIRPLLFDRVANEQSIEPHCVATIADSKAFRLRQRQSLFLGLSDGARIDTFRRCNRDLNHEQIRPSHELSETRVTKLVDKLAEHLDIIDPDRQRKNPARFRTLVLLDDFSASGSSYYLQGSYSKYGGKIAQFQRDLIESDGALRGLVSDGDYEIVLLLYIATEQAIQYLTEHSQAMWTPHGINCRVEVVQRIPEDVRFLEGCGHPFEALVQNYYDHDGVWDSSLEKGGTSDAKYGFAACGLPVVLHHNTPNNSLALLWMYEELKVRGLFPRIQRHKEIA